MGCFPFTSLCLAACHRAVDTRDARYDGVFFVGITSTGIYCRPVCPSRRANPARRRFFPTAQVAENAGFRACLRCRPAPGSTAASVDALGRIARRAMCAVDAGELNERSVGEFASMLGVSERHLRRATRLFFGVSLTAVARGRRLTVAARLLSETTMSVTQVAYTSGFRSLRRFNDVFRSHFGSAPLQWRSAATKQVTSAVRGA